MSDTIQQSARRTNPIIVMLLILALAMCMTWLIDSGRYERDGHLVVPGSYQELEKPLHLADLFDPTRDEAPGIARPVGIPGAVLAIPAGLSRMAGLIFMVLMIGGMFGILTESGAIDSGLERLVHGARGNVYVLVSVLMLVFAAGSTFLGLASEYLLIIPLAVALAQRLGLPDIIGLAIVTIAVKAGYLSSVTNPIPLSIAQPLVGLQVFSGASVRFWFFLVFTATGIVFLLWRIRQYPMRVVEDWSGDGHRMPGRHLLVLALLGAGIAMLVYGSNRWQWSHEDLSGYYIGLSMILAAAAGLGASEAARAFVSGMKKILMATMLIGVASAVAITLQQGQILDAIVHGLTRMVGEDSPLLAAYGMLGAQLLLDFLIPSTSGQAAVSMPIMGPLGQLSGVPPQSTVLAFLFGNGITNLLTPTSGTLLAYLATARIGWWEWARFVFALWLIFIVVAVVLLTISVNMGF